MQVVLELTKEMIIGKILYLSNCKIKIEFFVILMKNNIFRINWTQIQLKLFSGIVNILNNDHLAKLACSGAHNEPILKRVVVDKSVKRIRSLFATVAWDLKLTQWLHQLLMDSLSTPYLAAYLDILQVFNYLNQ